MIFQINDLTYRKDIVALRAIAVLSVVLYHAQFHFFKGGYVGVDIFFVISGFLITNILVSEHLKEGGIKLSSFYLKRARRILPALFFTLFLTTILAIAFLSSNLLNQFGLSLTASALSISNIYFYSQAGYFDSSSSTKLLLHTWSLGIEEQFYLFWPIFISIIFSIKRLTLNIKILILIFIASMSLFLSQFLTIANPSASFFLTPFRVFEFAIGGILCFIPINTLNYKFFKNLLFILGLSLLFYAVFIFTDNTIFPGLNALIPCLGAAFFILANKNSAAFNKFYKKSGLLFIGKISYSLYLVHWPIVVFWGILISKGMFSKIDSLLILLSTFFISLFSFYLIESPYRVVTTSNRYFIKCCILVSILFSILGYCIHNYNGWTWRPWIAFEIINSEHLIKQKNLRFITRQKICITKGWANCDEIVPGKINVLVLGDSHAVDALNALYAQFPEFNYTLSTLGGCPPYQNISLIAPLGLPDLEKCLVINKQRFDINYLRQFNLIAINNLMGWYTPEHLISYLTYLYKNNIKNVIVFGNYLTLKRNMSELLNTYGFDKNEIKKWITDQDIDETLLKDACNKFGYIYVSKKNIFCNNNDCELFNANKIPFTYDEHHLSYEFSIEMLNTYKDSIQKYIIFN